MPGRLDWIQDEVRKYRANYYETRNDINFQSKNLECNTAACSRSINGTLGIRLIVRMPGGFLWYEIAGDCYL